MPAPLALLLTSLVIFWLFRWELRLRELPSSALWIPAVWVTLVGSRTITLWLLAVGINVTGNNNLEGSPVDMLVSLGLDIAAVVVLVRRSFGWGAFVRRNKVLILLYVYLAFSALWSEHSFPTLKRAIRDFGHIPVALVLLTEADSWEAIRIVFVRVSYLLFPLSVVLIKYFPHIGRVPSRNFTNMFTGVTMHKNELGEVVFVFGLFIVADLMALKQQPGEYDKVDRRIRYGMLAIGGWLLITSDSVTNMICLPLACLLLWGTKRLLRLANPKLMLFRALGMIFVAGTLEYTLNISDFVFGLFGRNGTLTGRTEIWDMVRQVHTNPIIGCGFYSFWTTAAAQEISALYMGTLGTTHNGILEMYLDGGVIGAGLLILVLLVWGRRSIQLMLEGTVRGRVTFVFWLLAIAHNFSETGYFRFTPIWFTLLLLMIECPPSHQAMLVEKSSTDVVLADSA
jgi:exopolysaccharide production protein ExoQ